MKKILLIGIILACAISSYGAVTCKTDKWGLEFERSGNRFSEVFLTLPNGELQELTVSVVQAYAGNTFFGAKVQYDDEALGRVMDIQAKFSKKIEEEYNEYVGYAVFDGKKENIVCIDEA